ncbi:MAG TPA: site-2 protease family protein [Stellaceae bacterium]|jgi:Zn-dependent protease|nr:site-2 protease family protein [Stellaceae bacterium]
MPLNYAQIIQALSVGALPVIFAITLHEAAHGFVAHRLGDDTAFRMGRVTFNPIKHIDLFGTIILPLILFASTAATGRPFVFGYAKPVPVRFDRLNHPRRDMVWVALAGPVTNIILALISAILVAGVPYLPSMFRTWSAASLQLSIVFNLIIAVFNMIPLPPLDGGRVAVGLLPDFLAIPLARSERYGMLILIGLLFILPLLGEQLHMDLNVVWWVIQWPINWLADAIQFLTGVDI